VVPLFSKQKWWDRIDDIIYQQQKVLIHKRYGKKAADTANYGWGVSQSPMFGDEPDFISYATKIYLDDRFKVLVSEADYPSIHPSHDWRDY